MLWLVTSVIAVAAGGRFFGHYFHLMLPPLCLLAAPPFLRLWARAVLSRALVVLVRGAGRWSFFVLATAARPLAEARRARSPLCRGRRADHRLAGSMNACSSGEPPQLYVLSRRPLGSRFTFCNYMTGESPGTPTESGQRNADRSSLPAAWGMLLSDFEQRRPLLFVDASAAGWDGYDKYPLTRYPLLRALRRSALPARWMFSAGVVMYRRLPSM